MSTTPVHVTKTNKHQAETKVRRQAAADTLTAMNKVMPAAQLTHYSNRSIEEVEALQKQVSDIIPAGNIVGMVMNGLIRHRDRNLPPNQAQADVSALMRGLDMLSRNILPNAFYSTLFIGPAAVLSAYQKLLTLTGKDTEDAFPEGLWQFYLEFAMREDAARHANETIGFQQALLDYQLNLSPVDQLAAWVCAVSQIYFQYDNLLYNQWRERIYLDLLEQAVKEANLNHKLSFKRLPQAWAAQRPYRRGQDAKADENYTQYRQRRFDNFLQSRLRLLPVEYRDKVEINYNQQLFKELSAYQQQMSILATLNPDQYRESKTLISLWQARVAIIYKNRYYFLPACQTDRLGQPLLFETEQNDSQFHSLHPKNGQLFDEQGTLLLVGRKGKIYKSGQQFPCGYLHPTPFQAIRRQLVSIFEQAHQAAHQAAHQSDAVSAIGLDDQLVAIKRSEQVRTRQQIQTRSSKQAINALKLAPVIINWDEQDDSQPLSYIRQNKRGIGDHALTIFRTPNSMVFDQSHIFFDGVWGMAVAEILTNEAISWASYFNNLLEPEVATIPPYTLAFPLEPKLDSLEKKTTTEISAENTDINFKALYKLCKLLPKRYPDLKLTVNDVLIFHRCQFGRQYQPSVELEDALFELNVQTTLEMQAICDLINDAMTGIQAKNPAIVIPMEASAVQPKERLYPTTFRNPFTEIWGIYKKTLDSLENYNDSQTQENWVQFNDIRRTLLGQLNYFGQIMRAYKKVALEGGSTSATTLKLMAYVPDSLLKMLDEIPQRFDILNELIKGEEVFSNVGRVARGSSLSRFISAKDDNDNKTLAWGVITDDQDRLHISLRDFRPHVAALSKIDRTDLAQLITTDFLNAFVTEFNQFVKNLLDILNTNATHAPKEAGQ